jgi:hypothetical protein
MGREPGFAHAARSGDGDQTEVVQKAAELGEFFGPAHEPVQLCGEIALYRRLIVGVGAGAMVASHGTRSVPTPKHSVQSPCVTPVVPGLNAVRGATLGAIGSEDGFRRIHRRAESGAE